MFNNKVKTLLALAKMLMVFVKTIINVTFTNTNKLFVFGKKKSFNIFLISCVFLLIVGLHSAKEAFL